MKINESSSHMLNMWHNQLQQILKKWAKHKSTQTLAENSKLSLENKIFLCIANQLSFGAAQLNATKFWCRKHNHGYWEASWYIRNNIIMHEELKAKSHHIYNILINTTSIVDQPWCEKDKKEMGSKLIKIISLFLSFFSKRYQNRL